MDCIPYTTFGLKFPEGDFIHSPTCFTDPSGGILEQISSESSGAGAGAAASTGVLSEWEALMKNMEPLANIVSAIPTVALRGDIGVLATLFPFLSNVAAASAGGGNPLNNFKLMKPFQCILNDSGISKQSFLQKWLDLICFCLSGLPTDGTIMAEMSMMLGEFYEPSATMDCPRGGAMAIVHALVHGLKKHGGSIFMNSHVKRIMI